jgi:hypothetical protein
MRLHRPHVPVKVKCQVLARQLGATSLHFDEGPQGYAGWSYHQWLDYLLRRLEDKIGDGDDHHNSTPLQLDHDPALQNREFNKRTRKYTPDANDPRFLIYRTKEAHRIKTLVRGDGAQLSDAAIARKRKRKERKANRRKVKWASRALKSASRWPKRKVRYSTG